jgi:hypothetical protein
MNPNENQQPTEPIDYLNQIAPKPARKMDILRSKPVMFGGIAIIVLIIIVIIGSSLSGGTNTSEQLAARLISTQTVVDSANSNIQSNQLLSFNSNLNIYLINTIRDIKPILAKEGIDTNSLSSTVISAESNTKLLATLEDARLNAVYDRTYAREMSYRLDTTLTLMRQIYESTGNSNLKSFLENAYKNLAPTQAQFANFNAADS